MYKQKKTWHDYLCIKEIREEKKKCYFLSYILGGGNTNLDNNLLKKKRDKGE
jgi:hypothetical protein